MARTHDILRGTLILIAFALAFGWFAWWRFRRSTDRAAMLVRWLVTAGLGYFIVGHCGVLMAKGMAESSYLALVGFLQALVTGLVLAIIWVPEIVEGIGRKFGSLYDGGSAPIEPKPLYSIALALRARGQYTEAVTEVRQQLRQFPMDVEGQMLLAAVEAENLDDLPGAELTIKRFCAQPGHAPANLAYALNQLADWHLKIAKDREAARRALEKIIELLPDTEFSLQASQRIGRLADTETLLAGQNRRRITLRKGADNIGLMTSSAPLQPAAADPEQLAAEYVRHLSEHPLDGHIREQLAVLYANHYHRLDLAADQLDQLIQLPNQSKKEVVRWLNLLADLQIANGAPLAAAQATLQRILDQYPDLAASFNTRRRMDTLKLEYKAQQTTVEVHLATYEQNIGLRRTQQEEEESKSKRSQTSSPQEKPR